MPYNSIFGNGPAPTPAPRTGYQSIFDGEGPSTVGAGGEPDEGGVSLFGFLGNAAQEVGDMAKGITSLVGMGIHDVGGLVAEATTFGKADTDYQLDDVAMALPKALATDYNERYGISKFADGDIWGGLAAIAKGLYERPLSAIGDVLMVGKAGTLAAKAGILGDVTKAGTLGAKVLGPGETALTSLTSGTMGGAEAVGMRLSQNPVARIAQNKVFDLMSFKNAGGAQAWIDKATDFGAGARGQMALDVANPANRILRPAVSTFMEKGGVHKTLSAMRMSVSTNSAPYMHEVRRLLDPELNPGVDQELALGMLHGTKSPLLDEIPQDLSPVGRVLPNDPEVPIGLVPDTPELDAEVGMALTGQYRGDLIPIRPGNKHGLESPHSMDPETPTGSNRYFLKVGEDADIGAEVQKFADAAGGPVVAKLDYGAQPGSYDLPHYSIQTKNGSVLDVAVGTPDQLQSAQAWSHISTHIKSKYDEMAVLDDELKAAAATGMTAERQLGIDAARANLLEEIDAATAFSDGMFAYSRRRAAGGPYDQTLAAVDRIRPVVYNGATMHEIMDGALTFRKAMDRSFGAIRAEKWSLWMRDIEKMLKAHIERNLDAGTGADFTESQIIEVLEHTLGQNNPWTERALLSSRKEIIPFETDEVMPAGLGRPGPLRGQLATGDLAPQTPGQVLRSKRSVWDDVEEDIRPTTNAERAEEIANRISNRLRAETHTAMVENGEFEGLDWKTLAQTQVDGILPQPQYYPHIKASRATADVVMSKSHDRALQTVIESEGPRMKKWHGDLYESGLYERDPIEAYNMLFRQIQAHVEMRDTLNSMIQKYGRKVPDAELQNWTLRTQGEVLMTQEGINGMINHRTNFLALQHENIMSGMDVDSAAQSALEVIERQAVDSIGELGNQTVYALPRHVGDLMKKLGKKGVMGDSFNFYYDTATGLWKSMVLSLSPRWVVNNTLGNMVYMGVHRPGAIKEFIRQLMPGARDHARLVFGERALDGWEQNFMHSEEILRAEQRLALRAGRAGNEFAEGLAKRPFQTKAPVSTIRAVSRKVRDVNSYIEAAARRGVAINEVRRLGIVKTAGRFDRTNVLLQKAAEEGLDVRQYGTILDEINRTLGDYVTMSPVEANVIRRYLVPFYSFYRHTAKFVARMPFEHPAKMMVLQRLTQLERDMNPYMPEYMMGSIPLGGTSFLALGGANPLESVAEAYWPQMTHPLLGAAMQRTMGVNPFGRPWIAPEGEVAETWRGNYAVQRNSSGQVIGVRQMQGNWQPPLAGFLLNQAIPQTTMLFDPWQHSFKQRAISLTGASLRDYDAASTAYYSQQAELEALTRAMGTPPA